MISRFYDWLESRVDSFPDTVPTKPPSRFLGFIIHFSRPFLPLIVISALFSVAIAIVEVLMFAFLGDIVDWLSATQPDQLWNEHGIDLVLIALMVVVLYPLLYFVGESISHQGLLGNFAMRTRWESHRYLLRQSMAFYQDDFAGRVAARMMQTALAVREVVLKTSEILLFVAVYFASALVLFASADWRLVLPMLAWLVGYLVILRLFIPRLAEVSRAQADARADVTGRVVDSYTHIGTVKMFADANYEDDYARSGMKRFLGTVYGQMRLSTALSASLATLNAFLIFGIGAVAIALWSHEIITTGAIAFAVGLVLRLIGMSNWILWEVANLFENVGVVMDGIDTIARDRSVVDRPDARPLSVQEGEIAWQDIHFNYGKVLPEQTANVIDGLSLTIKPGEKVGLVGRSGAGKSTLVSLLLRFHDLEGGRILIDGQDIAAVQQDSLRAAIGMVTQDTSLLHRTVAENIAYGRAEATREQVIAAARKAEAHDFISDLEDLKGNRGYDAHVGERGVKLSGGQRQRIAIARVLLKDAPILILDEATSALDSEVEAAIQQSLYSLMEGKTVLAIAHRLSTIAAMDRLVVMDQGRIVEQGTHAELIHRDGLYAELWARQSGGFLAREEVA
ncbi:MULTISPECIES: ABC transporter ATP-binding protein [unclassified Minwuia]|jgi:ATP-binding cassette, subfamily B, multidrug efflux pump|uniref:ABC transporter ATP-binding protein n=1 Tax=unclassified Minwuia TaxID=2618799 RepID=UPI00247B0C41|nr:MULTISPECIES: ABC transporter ATP-binding protein [unclassified Minwuia]